MKTRFLCNNKSVISESAAIEYQQRECQPATLGLLVMIHMYTIQGAVTSEDISLMINTNPV